MDATITVQQSRDGAFTYEAAGNPSSPPIVFLHGLGGAARLWRSQLAHFSAKNHAVAWDMPGYAGSAPLSQASIATLAQALRRFLDALGLERPFLVGHSIGGMIVQRFIADHPRGARAIVLAQTSPAFGKPDADWQRDFVAARLGPLDHGETMASMAAGIVADLAGEDADPDGLALARDCMASVPEPTYRAMIQALVGFDMKAALPRIAVPTLALAGAKDEIAPADMMARMAERIPRARYVRLDGVGHLAPVERPAAFNAAVSDFIYI